MADFEIDLPTKRYKSHCLTGSMLSTMDDIESNLKPPYLRDINTWKVYTRTRAAVEYATVMKSNKDYLEQRKPKRWHIQDVDLNGWRENKIDKRMIYHPNEDSFKMPDELKPTSRPNTPEQDVPRPNVDLKVEKKYILETKERIRSPINMTAKRLMKQTMKEFNKPVEPIETHYCSPQDHISIESEISSPRDVKFDTLTSFPMGVTRWARRHEGTICTHNARNSLGQFCDVLGPYVCKKCIEITNRRIIAEIQKESFPDLDSSITNIVAPRLSRTMMYGERLMSRESARPTEADNQGQNDTLPQLLLVSKVDPKHFKRPGIEGIWHQRAKTYLHGSTDETENEDKESASVNIVSKPFSAKSNMRNSAIRHTSRSKPNRSVTISSINTVVY